MACSKCGCNIFYHIIQLWIWVSDEIHTGVGIVATTTTRQFKHCYCYVHLSHHACKSHRKQVSACWIKYNFKDLNKCYSYIDWKLDHVYSEFFRVQLFLVGGPALIGEKYDTVVRIDDDDIRHVKNIKNIDYCKAKNLNIPGSL